MGYYIDVLLAVPKLQEIFKAHKTDLFEKRFVLRISLKVVWEKLYSAVLYDRSNF